MKAFLLVAVPVVTLTGNLIRFELVARAQDAQLTPAADAPKNPTAAKTERNLPIRGSYLRSGDWLALIGLPAIQKEIGMKQGSAQYDEIHKSGPSVYEFQMALSKVIEEHRNDTKAVRDKAMQEVSMALGAKHAENVQKLLKPEQTAQIAPDNFARCRCQCSG